MTDDLLKSLEKLVTENPVSFREAATELAAQRQNELREKARGKLAQIAEARARLDDAISRLDELERDLLNVASVVWFPA